MSEISIVSNPTSSSIFVVKANDELVTVLAWEQGRSAVQFNFHRIPAERSRETFIHRMAMLNCNLEAVMSRMLRCGIPDSDRERVLGLLSSRIRGWESDWHIDSYCDLN